MIGYSNLMHSLFSKAEKKAESDTKFYDVISMGFKLNDKVDYHL